jgi:hypothetical protein
MVKKKFENLTTAQEFAKENKMDANKAINFMAKNGGELPTKPYKPYVNTRNFGETGNYSSVPRLEFAIGYDDAILNRYNNILRGNEKNTTGYTTDELKEQIDRKTIVRDLFKEKLNKKPKLKGQPVDIDALSYEDVGYDDGEYEGGGELPTKRKVLMPKENMEYDRDLRMNQDWMGSLKKAKDLDSMYATPVGTWKGNPMSLQQFTEMPEYVTNYYKPDYAIEFNKNRLGLPNTFQDINLGKVKQDPSLPRYQPASTITPGNEVAYYKKGGYVPMYKKGKDRDEEGLTNYQRRFLKNLRRVEKIFNPDRPYAKKLADPNQQLISHIGTTGFTIPQDREINYIDIPMGQVIKGPIEDINPTSKPRTGIGKPTIARKENLNSQKVDIPNFNMPTFGKNLSPLTKYGLMGRPQEQTISEEEDNYNSWLNPAGHMLSAAGAMADYAAMKKARPEDVSLGRVGAERISLARQRLANTRNTASARAMASSAARSSGMNAGVALSNILAANTGANRLLGQQNAELLEREESANAQMRQQANMVNAELAAQEGLFNTQQQNAYRMMMAQNNPLGNIARTAASYFADNTAYQQGYDKLPMLAPNAELYRDPDAKWKNNPFARPKVRLR